MVDYKYIDTCTCMILIYVCFDNLYIIGDEHHYMFISISSRNEHQLYLKEILLYDSKHTHIYETVLLYKQYKSTPTAKTYQHSDTLFLNIATINIIGRIMQMSKLSKVHCLSHTGILI